MALLGQGVLANWHDVPQEIENEFNAWHTHEHIPERVAVPGFLRGRRYVALEGAPRYLILYETEQLEILTSEPYLARLNDPTDWTRRMSQVFTTTIRTPARVTASLGEGIGGVAAVWRLAPAPDGASSLRHWLTESVMQVSLERWGITGAHLLEADEAAASVETAEKALRQGPDVRADWILMLEGIDAETVSAACSSAGDPELEGAAPGHALAVYRLQTVLAAD